MTVSRKVVMVVIHQATQTAESNESNWEYSVYTVRNVLADFAVCVTDGAIAKLYVTKSLVKQSELVENFVTKSKAIASLVKFSNRVAKYYFQICTWKPIQV